MSNNRESAVGASGEGRRKERAVDCDRRTSGPGLARNVLAMAIAALLPLQGVLAQVRTADESRDTTNATDERTDARADPTQLDTIRVTGTRIKGGSVPSPVVAIDAEQLREEDFSDLGDVIRSVPQNFRRPEPRAW